MQEIDNPDLGSLKSNTTMSTDGYVIGTKS